jgi:CheY-like chemotaxis protein
MRNYMPILLVEDDDVDVLITRRAFSELKVTNELVHKVDGRDALEYLRDKSSSMPCVILLDLNMPRMNGFEFLKIVKADDVLKKIPVVVLTTSTDGQDVIDSFNLGIAGYVVKPVNYMEFVDAIRTLHTYWTLSRLPSENFETSIGYSSAKS